MRVYKATDLGRGKAACACLISLLACLPKLMLAFWSLAETKRFAPQKAAFETTPLLHRTVFVDLDASLPNNTSSESGLQDWHELRRLARQEKTA